MKLKAPKGTFDIVPGDRPLRHNVLATTSGVMARAAVEELSPPIFEHSEVFSRAVGATSDLVVQKEMYTFTDRGDRSLTLRPEFTGGVLRAYIEHGMHTLPTPVKLWSHGPVFRAENVQRGRFRQFHQISCELIGLETPTIDAEAIALLVTTLSVCGLTGLSLRLGSVGDPGDSERYNAYLREALTPSLGELSPASRARLQRNPMRILDSKDATDQALVADLKRPLDFLNLEAGTHFDGVCRLLAAMDIPFAIDRAVVRGLDYYRRTAFEIHHGSIGAQSAVGGGGRYDGLIALLGGPPHPGVGWALGIERLLDALTEEGVAAERPPGPELFLVPLDEPALEEVAALAFRLRGAHRVSYGYRPRKPGKGLAEAARSGANLAGLRGAAEREQDLYRVKNLETGEQRDVATADLEALLATT